MDAPQAEQGSSSFAPHCSQNKASSLLSLWH
jgi:hypothetical protein